MPYSFPVSQLIPFVPIDLFDFGAESNELVVNFCVIPSQRCESSGSFSPGSSSVVPFVQSAIFPNCWAVSAGESCKRGSVTTSFMGFGKYFFASSEKRFASFLNVSQSDRLSHGVAMAGLNGWINGCMSVLLISYFSYHVAAGRTMSEYNPVPCMRKSILTNRSSFPARRFTGIFNFGNGQIFRFPT